MSTAFSQRQQWVKESFPYALRNIKFSLTCTGQVLYIMYKLRKKLILKKEGILGQPTWGHSNSIILKMTIRLSPSGCCL